jgi:hypothetical protein
MNNHYDLHSCSTLYRGERLAESQEQRLTGKDGSRLGSVSLLLVMVVLATAILLGAGCTDQASSTVDTDTNAPDHTASDTSGSSASASSSSSDDSSASASSVASPSAPSDGSSDSASPSASASASSSSSSSSSASSSSSDPNASNFAGMRSSSMECYTFYSDGTVELRHGGTSTVSDSGTYQGDEQFGEIVWDSGRWTSTVVAEGDGLIIDDVTFSPVDSCF